MVNAFHHDPRRFAGAGFAQDVIGHFVKLVIVLEKSPVALGHAPARIGFAFNFLHPLFLRFLRQVKPEFQQQHAFLRQHSFEVPDFLDALVQLRFRNIAKGAIEIEASVDKARVKF